ncbi:MAG: hypothetical protein C0614_02090 [Desulfuromonas sp.]|nr:MAG: hypothetical protein C0614_02090 [Desulfuromonas sp.]
MAGVAASDVSIVVSVYRDLAGLSLVLESLQAQTAEGFEIIVSEDGECDEVKSFLKTVDNPQLKHLSQPDRGWQKSLALNRAIKTARGEYLVFIDGDCVPNRNFVTAHAALAEQGCYLVGRRVFLGPEMSTALKTRQVSFIKFEKEYLRHIVKLHRDGVRHFEDGIALPATSLTQSIMTFMRGIPNIVGCNFSCFKKDMVAINGFDEDYEGPCVGEDEDIVWRLQACAIMPKSCRNFANIFHLEHPKNTSDAIHREHKNLMLKKIEAGQFFCRNGIEKNLNRGG